MPALWLVMMDILMLGRYPEAIELAPVYNKNNAKCDPISLSFSYARSHCFRSETFSHHLISTLNPSTLCLFTHGSGYVIKSNMTQLQVHFNFFNILLRLGL